jgi:hypothetical protein
VVDAYLGDDFVLEATEHSTADPSAGEHERSGTL